MVKIMEKIRKNKIYKLFMETLTNPVMQILPGQVAFFFVLSIFPIILILGVIAPTFDISMVKIVEFVKMSLPANTSKAILPLLTGKSFDINIMILILSSIYLISKGTKSIIIASSTVYGVKEHKTIQNIIKSIIITVLLALLFVFIAVISVFGEKILTILVSFAHLDNNYLTIYNMFRWPMTFFIIYFVIKIVYTIAPNKKVKAKDVTLGAITTTCMWVLVTIIYSYYVVHFSSYNLFYGSAANLVILLLWVYIISYIFVFGMVINVTRTKYSESINM